MVSTKSRMAVPMKMSAMPTFIANDVIKMPDVPRDIAEYRKHLAQIFG